MSTGSKFRAFPDDYLATPDTAERRVLEYWKRADVFGEQQRRREGAAPFVFYEGPPTANGRPGVHHVFSRAIKDAICRYRWMLGARVDRKAGWDTHGLPVELEVEKKLGISGKKQIEEIGIAKFNALCKESVFTYVTEWRELSERIGYWLDYDHPYVTFEPRYVESLWWILSRYHAQGLLEKRFKVLPYCPRCGTGLSSHEVGQGYRDVQDPSVTVRFPLVDEPGTSLLVWTTTPWTLPSNAGAAIHPELEYVKARSPKHPDEKFWVAKGRLEAVLGGDAEILETARGAALLGLRYRPPFEGLDVPALKSAALRENPAKKHTVLAGPFVSSEDGTGIVHMAPCYGADDYELGVREGLPILAAVGRDGRFATPVGAVAAGTFFKEADSELITQLKNSGRLFQRTTVQHSYPFCWRCDTALLYYATPAWFLKTTSYRDSMVSLNRETQWVPQEIGSGRFGEWLEGNVDWALSRDRYWGTPLPVWECEQCDTFEVVESIAALRSKATTTISNDFDPHRPQIDEVKMRCAKCGGETRRSNSVMDCWFDSGAMPFAQHGFPFTPGSREKVRDQFPAGFIAEGLDQTRGWFYTLHAIATFLTTVDRGCEVDGVRLELPAATAYRACVVNGLVLDAQGRKMSKRLGNAVNPFDAVKQFGADAVRLMLLGSGALHLSRRFDPDAISSLRRQVVLPLANCLQFFATYANEIGLAPIEAAKAGRQSSALLDRWIASRAATLAHEVGRCLDAFDLPGAVSALASFADAELSNWYVRRSRRRFQFGSLEERAAGLATLRDVLGVAARCLAPVAPFAAEMLWHRVHPEGAAAESVHLQQFPTLDRGRSEDRDPGLEHAMGLALVVARLARAIRERNKIRNTIPLPSIALLVPRGDASSREFLAAVEEAVREEVNVDSVVWDFYPPDPGQEHVFALKAKPNFPVVGKRAGKNMKALQAALEKWSTEDVLRFVASGNRGSVALSDGGFELFADDVKLQAEFRGDAACESDRGITVALTTKFEGAAEDRAMARELASAVNQARRDAGFRLSERCIIQLAQSEAAERPLRALASPTQRAAWLSELRADDVRLVPTEGRPAWRTAELLDGISVQFEVLRVG